MWDEPYELGTQVDTETHHERVLVVVVPCLDDWQRIHTDHWYRIPVARAPKRLAADYVAFYHPKCFGDWRWSVRFYAPIEQYRIVARRELLPDQPTHPRADDLYYKLEIGELCELVKPIPSHKLRRITFIMTTLANLLTAEDVNDLWLRSNARDRLWQVLRTREIMARQDYVIRDECMIYCPDLVVLCVDRNLAIECARRGQIDSDAERADALLQSQGWALERFDAEEIMRNAERCVELVSSFVFANGGLDPTCAAGSLTDVHPHHERNS